MPRSRSCKRCGEGADKVADVWWKLGISEQTLYTWKRKYARIVWYVCLGHFDVPELSSRFPLFGPIRKKAYASRNPKCSHVASVKSCSTLNISQLSELISGPTIAGADLKALPPLWASWENVRRGSCGLPSSPGILTDCRIEFFK
jgi:hypothetical protein